MHVAINIAIDEVGRDRIYNYRSVLVGVWVCAGGCVGVYIHVSFICGVLMYGCSYLLAHSTGRVHKRELNCVYSSYH